MKQGTSNVVSDNIEPDATVIYDEKTFHGEELAITRHHTYGFTSAEYELPKGYYWSSYFLGTFLATTLSQTSGTGTYVMMAAVINQIDADIGPNSNIFWVFTVYTLSTAVGLLLFGRLTDLFGRRWFFISASLFGLVGSVVCATAQNIPTVIGGEVLIGFGATAGLSYTTVLGELVPMKSRFFAVGILFVGNIPVGGFGAAIGYAFQLYTPVAWRGVFWLTVGTNAAAALCWFRFYHPPTFHMKNANETRLHLIKNFDYIGTILFIAGFILFFMSLSWGGSAYAWKSAQVISTLVIGTICLISLAVYEIYVPLKEPLIPVHLFKNRGWVVANLLLATGASVYYAGALLWPSMVAGIYATDSEMRTGWLSCLVGVSIALGELTGGLCAERIGRVKYQCIFFVTVGSTCLAALATCGVNQQTAAIALIVVSLFTIGWNECICFSLTTICIYDQREIGAAAGVAGSTRSIISTTASTVYQVVLRARLADTIPQKVAPAVISAGLPATSVPVYFTALTYGTADALAAVPGITPTVEAAGAHAYKIANAEAFRSVFLTSIAFGCIAIGLSFLIPNVDDLMTQDVAATLHKRNNVAEVVGEGPKEKLPL